MPAEEKEVVNPRIISEGHILYTFNCDDIYIQNALNYIVAGVKKGESVLVIESSRNIPRLREHLVTLLDEKERNRIHYTNNFTFYTLNGAFHASKVLNYFCRIVKELTEKEGKFRLWTHVEWGDEEEFLNNIEEYEQSSDEIIRAEQLLCVCAYREKNISSELKQTLLQFHSHEMSDKDLLTLE
ncbi:MEDS domain-containing protein [Evansella clarkii]|uniref:MEDS domain-containing protein n=1 Tax=Evansella clarkii TaxID=79879 RepID=UPI000B4307CB|nr:MEDS domain-containing protein [Evansella clarkii]